jgi:hypothetical protein
MEGVDLVGSLFRAVHAFEAPEAPDVCHFSGHENVTMYAVYPLLEKVSEKALLRN